MAGYFVAVQVDYVLFEVWVNAALLNENVELFIPLLVLLRIFIRLLPQKLQNPLGQKRSQLSHQGRILITLPGNIQRNILTIHHTSKESQEIGEQSFLAVLFDEDFFGVKTDLAFFLLEAVLLGVGFGDVEDGFYCHGYVGLEMHFVFVGGGAVHEFVEFLVLLLAYLFLVAGPDCFDEIYSLTVY